MDQDRNRMAGPDFITSLIFMATGVIVIVSSLRMRVFRTIIVSPGLFPAIIGGVFVLFGGIILVLSIRRGGAARAMHILSGGNLLAVWRSPRFRRGMIVFLSILVYVMLFGNHYLSRLNFSLSLGDSLIPVNTGFIITTGGYLLFSFFYLKALPRKQSALLALAVTLTVFYAFSKGFGIPVP